MVEIVDKKMNESFDYWGNPFHWKDMDYVNDLLSLYEQRRFLYQDIYIEHRIKELLAEGYTKSEICIEACSKPEGEGYSWSVTTNAPIREKLPKEGDDWEE